jgi:NADH dehydrogenase [ubiquinone] 1 alpha subcomplex assembly factor 7
MTEYDPHARRDTPLALKLKERIARDGPIDIQHFMHACLFDAEHGYYVKQPAIGAGGDFVTAPEISQIFGELIGLWCVAVWQQMGSPARLKLTELGPGRGTLMADALRSVRVLPAFLSAVQIEFVETSEVLIEQQRRMLAAASANVAAPIAWNDSLKAPAAGTAWIVVGNEFLDTFPLCQRVLHDDRWLQRTVTLDDDGRMQFATDQHEAIPDQGGFPEARPGDIRETLDSTELVSALAHHAECSQVAALFVDYGHVKSALGDTLQAVRQHRHEHPLTSPGQADLTCQVDFHAFAEAAHAVGLAIDGPVTQAEFLFELGITQRASRLMSANPDKAAMIEAGVARLLSPTGMGTRFKAVGLRSSALLPLPGFPAG